MQSMKGMVRFGTKIVAIVSIQTINVMSGLSLDLMRILFIAKSDIY